MFLQTYSDLNMMLDKNDDVKRNMSKIYIKYLSKIDNVKQNVCFIINLIKTLAGT